jgi:hypothetical protein
MTMTAVRPEGFATRSRRAGQPIDLPPTPWRSGVDPGPWSIERNAQDGTMFGSMTIGDAGGRPIAKAFAAEPEAHSLHETALLLAAAPSLLAACRSAQAALVELPAASRRRRAAAALRDIEAAIARTRPEPTPAEARLLIGAVVDELPSRNPARRRPAVTVREVTWEALMSNHSRHRKSSLLRPIPHARPNDLAGWKVTDRSMAPWCDERDGRIYTTERWRVGPGAHVLVDVATGAGLWRGLGLLCRKTRSTIEIGQYNDARPPRLISIDRAAIVKIRSAIRGGEMFEWDLVREWGDLPPATEAVTSIQSGEHKGGVHVDR